MNFEPESTEANFHPFFSQSMAGAYSSCSTENSIIQAIVEGSGGPDNDEMTGPGLRFVRHLLTISRSSRFGYIPNFKDMESIRKLAKQFIGRYGDSNVALQSFQEIVAA